MGTIQQTSRGASEAELTWREVASLSEAEMLREVRMRMLAEGKNIMIGIIRGRRRNPFISEPHTIITGCNDDVRVHRLMDNLYEVYRTDRLTEDGMCQMPWIGTLRHHKFSEFHIYSTDGGITKGFFVSFASRFSECTSLPSMTFVWVVPRFRRQGLFKQMYAELVERRGPVLVDSPNEACQMALHSLGYSRKKVVSFYNDPPPGVEMLPWVFPA